VNTIVLLGVQLRGKPYRPRTDDISVLISSNQTRRSDVLVDCGSPPPTSMEADEPRVVIAILSPSTTRYDRFRKLEEYKTVAAIKVTLLIDTERPRVTVWRRDGPSWGNSEVSGLDATIALPEIEAALPLADLYDGLPFEEDAAG
jgi:Uma2 family endonuclease